MDRCWAGGIRIEILSVTGIANITSDHIYFEIKNFYKYLVMRLSIPVLFVSMIICINGISQSNADRSATQSLFESDGILNITIKGNIRELLNNRTGEAKSFPVIMRYHEKEAAEDSVSISIKTRGHFRRMKSNCDYPPLLLQFSKKARVSNPVFSKQSKLKLVMPCKGEEFVVHEWLVYKLYNIISPFSYRARLVRVTLKDESRKKSTGPFYGILLEEEKQMSERNNMILVKRKMRPQQTKKEDFLRMAVFEYLIGNTDWSVEYLQNINLVAPDSLSLPITVPHDFDLAGIVNSPYAMPAEELQMNSVQERRYRGYCVRDITDFDSTIAFYNSKKKDIYDLYSGCTLLEEKYIKTTLKYLDDFYSIINNPKKVKNEFGYPCDPNGTGNVILKGLKEE